MNVAHFKPSVIPPLKPQINWHYPSAVDQFGNTYFKSELVTVLCPDGCRAVGYTAEQALATAEQQMPVANRVYLNSIYRRKGLL